MKVRACPSPDMPKHLVITAPWFQYKSPETYKKDPAERKRKAKA